MDMVYLWVAHFSRFGTYDSLQLSVSYFDLPDLNVFWNLGVVN